MYDASKIQQINNIARELMKHGQAGSMDEAIKKATLQVEGGLQMPAGMPAAPSPETQPAEPLPELPETVETTPAGSTTEDAMRIIEKLVSQQQTAVSRMTNAVNSHSGQFNDLNNKINSLIAGMTALQQEITKLKNSPITPPMKPKDSGSGQTQFKQEGAPAQKKPDGSGHARTGNYNPDDVSIEKFFYYGGK